MLASLAPLRKADACSIAIVGGGASGALMTAHLLKRAGDAVRVTLIEPREQIGRGLAYATENVSHRLNVRASNMSAFPDDPDHFWNWLQANGYRGEDRFCFLPRLVYGRYLGSLIEGRLVETDPRVCWIREIVTGLNERDGSVTLRLSGSETAVFDMVVLCCGHEASETLEAPFVSPWEDPSLWNTAPDSTILILGTGLTMVDAAIALSESGHRGPIVTLSRRGLLPQAHAASMPRQSRKRNCRRLRRSLLFCIGFARERAMKCEAAEIGEASLTVCDHTSRRSGAPCRAHPAEGSSNTRAPGGTFTATEWRRRSKQRSERCRRAASCESWPAISLRSTRNETARAFRYVRAGPKLWSAWRSPV
jgi:uncharacterized NAD(P)/FAD-binding protein YdhS